MENHIAKGKAKWVIGRSPPTVSGENVFISFILKKKKSNLLLIEILKTAGIKTEILEPN